MKLIIVVVALAITAVRAGTTPEGIDWLNKNEANEGVVALPSARLLHYQSGARILRVGFPFAPLVFCAHTLHNIYTMPACWHIVYAFLWFFHVVCVLTQFLAGVKQNKMICHAGVAIQGHQSRC